MYLILIKYFYYFYYLKKNKKFKFFILLDLIFFLMKKYFNILIIKKKILKYKNIFFKQLTLLQQELKKKNNSLTFKQNNTLFLSTLKQFYILTQVEPLVLKKLSSFNEFIISFLPTQLLPLGNRKKFYNLLNKKFKRFFILIKKKLNKKFFFYYLVQLFRKLKFLFVKSDPFLNKKQFLFDFFSLISLESSYSSLLQYYRQHNKKDALLKNKFLSFFNLISFYVYRIDFFLFKFCSFFPLSQIRTFIFNKGIIVNNHKIQTTHYFLNKYDLVKIDNFFYSGITYLYVFYLKNYFSFLSKYVYKISNDVKKKYYIALFKIVKSNSFTVSNYLTSIIINKNSFNKQNSYTDLMENIFYFFFTNHNNEYTFDRLNNYKGNYKIEYEFPFFLKQKKKDLFFNTKPMYLNNVYYSYTKSSCCNKLNTHNISYLNNFTFLYFFLFKYKTFYYYTYNNKMIVSPFILNKILVEQKKLFYYFTLVYNINFLKLI